MSHAGRLLVATPLIGDTNFSRAVVALIAHDDGGAFGVVLNRPSDTPVSLLGELSDVDDGWFELAAVPSMVFVGGPVATDSVIGIVRATTRGCDEGSLENELAVADLAAPPPDGELTIRFFAGSAGWGPGQMEDEIADGAWWVLDNEPTDVFTSDPSGLWRAVLRRQRGTLAWLANHPDDPSAN